MGGELGENPDYKPDEELGEEDRLGEEDQRDGDAEDATA
jgi:hypothetical protein